MFTSPFNPVTGNGLGVSYSSLNQIGGIFPQSGIGQAGVQCYVNLVNGNLIIKDLMVRLIESNGPMELGFYYNTQVGPGNNNWQFAIKKLILPANNQTIMLQEEDGHLTTYTNSGNNIYVAPAFNDGTPYLKLNNNTWQWYHPKTQMIEVYSANGLLQSRTNAVGKTTQFYYDNNNNLNQINGPSGDTYQITWSGTEINIYDSSTGTNKLLQTYILGSNQRITQTPDGYQIIYTLGGNSNGTVLAQIKQSDGTEIGFYNTISSVYGNQVKGFRLGNDVTYFFDYPTPQNNNVATVRDGVGTQTKFYIDSNNRTSKITQQTGFDATGEEIDTTSVTYTAAGQVQSITKPEGQLLNQSTSYQYGIYGLITQKNDPNGQITQYNYFNNANNNCVIPTYLISTTRILNNQNLTTYYVYDTNYNGNNYIFRRFMISPLGRVTQYQPDLNGNIQYLNQFFNATFNTTNLNPNVPIPLSTLNTWVQQQFAQNLPQQASLTAYTYNTRSQITSKVDYANTDTKGNGISDAFSSYEYNQWDEFGNLLIHQFLQVYPTTLATTSQKFDGLQRLIQNVDALNDTTSYQYNNNQTIITYPNNSTDTKTYEPSGLLSIDTANALNNKNQQETRITTYYRDTAGRVVITQLPDQQIQITFYDKQNRLGISITPNGVVTQTIYNRNYNYKSVTTYANSINTSTLYNPQNLNLLPTASQALALIVPDLANDRTAYEFRDASNRLIWEVDGLNYATQHFYDNLNREIATVAYADELSGAELTQLMTGQTVIRTPDFSVDRGIQYFYDNDSKKIGRLISAGFNFPSNTLEKEKFNNALVKANDKAKISNKSIKDNDNIDATGYLTQYFLDCAGRVYKTTKYATRVPVNLANLNLNAVVPASTVNDANLFIFMDARGNKIATVDGDNTGRYLTSITNLPCGLAAQSTRYANPINVNWINNPTIMPATPTASTEDQTTINTYDLLNRIVNAIGVMNKNDATFYNNMGDIYSQQTTDLNNLSNLAGDYTRGTQTQYDGWCQKTAEANALVNALLLAPGLTPQQIATIWQTQSLQHVYDNTGLLLYTIMPPRQGNTTQDIYYYYYNLDRKLILIVDPNRNAIQKTLTSFYQPSQIRKYYNAIPSTTVLAGGFMTSDLQTVLNNIQNAKDEVTSYIYDQRGQVTQITDPNQNLTTKSYTAFKQVYIENLPINSQQPSMSITHYYEGRGKEVKTTKASGTLIIFTNSQYLNLYGKKTQFTDELNTNYIYQYDTLGRVIVKTIDSTSDGITITTNTFTLDSFGRVLTDTDSLSNVTNHQYNQQSRTHLIIYPVTTVTKILTLNIYNQKIICTDSLNNTEKWQHTPDGKVAVYTDQLNNSTTDTYDLLSRNILQTDACGVNTSLAYDGAGHLVLLVADTQTLKLQTQYTPDAFGNNLTIIDPRGTTISNTFDGCNNLTQSIIDPNNSQQNYTGLNIIKAKTYNAQGLQMSFIIGDANNANQYNESNQIDPLNRPIGKVVDPTGLNLKTVQTLDAASEVIADQDANGNIIRKFFNGLKLKRFEAGAAGDVYERNYDTEKKLIYERKYYQGVNPSKLSNSTTIQQLAGMLTIDPQDSYKYYFYDQNGNERFIVNSVGQVHEKQFNDVGKCIKEIIYSTANITAVANLNYNSLITWASLNSTTTDRITYRIRDAKQRECFTINSNNILSQTVFNGDDKVLTTVTFANPVNPQIIVPLPLSQILLTITLDPTRDRYNYRILDNMQRCEYEVDGEGTVTYHEFDEKNNEILTAVYNQQIQVPQSYNTIVGLVNNLPVPSSTNASITQKVFDRADRNTSVTDPLNFQDQFKLDACGNVLIHTDKNNNQWNNTSDRANRLTDLQTPPVSVVSVLPSQNQALSNNLTTKQLAEQPATKKPQYPIITIAGQENNSNLFALTLAIKKALLNKPSAKNAILQWPLIEQVDDKSVQKKSAQNLRVAGYLRIALVKAFEIDQEHKNRTLNRFLTLCGKYLDSNNHSQLRFEHEALFKSNKDYLSKMTEAWHESLKDISKVNMDAVFSAITVTQFKEKDVQSLYQDLLTLIGNNVSVNMDSKLPLLFAKHCPDSDDLELIDALLIFYRLLMATWRRVENDRALKAINVNQVIEAQRKQFLTAVINYLNRRVFDDIKQTSKNIDRLQKLLKYSSVTACQFDQNGRVIKMPNKQQLTSAHKLLFAQYNLYTTNNAAQVFDRYCQYVKNNPVKLDLDELTSLAKYWNVNLTIILSNGEKHKTLNTQNENTLDVQLCNPYDDCWQVVDVHAKPLTEKEADNPNNITYRIKTNEGINTSIQPSPVTLTPKSTTLSVIKHFNLDGNGNKQQIIEGYQNTVTQPRTLNMNYTPDNKISGTSINNVPIDNPNQNASYQNRPETSVTLTTTINYDSKRNKVAEQNENGVWTFYVYDSENREVYRIKQNIVGNSNNSSVTQKIYNVFNNVTQEISYATPLNLDLSQYTQTGIPLSIIQQSGVITQSANDRKIIKTYDNCDNVISIQRGPIFYYLPNANNGNPIFGMSNLQTKMSYTAFNQCYLQQVLINPQQNSWSQKLCWFNRVGKLIGECDTVYRVKLYKYDAFKNEVYRIEWANPPSTLPSPQTTYTELQQSYSWSQLDRIFTKQYNNRQELILETKTQLVNANTQGISYQTMTPTTKTNVPVVTNVNVQNLKRSYTYIPTGKQCSVTDEAQNTKFNFYDARGIMIASTDVPRTVDPSHPGTQLVPLTYYLIDLFGKQIGTTKFKQGTNKVTDPTILPVPIATDPDDQKEIKFFDIRGLTLWQQDADGYVKGFTYTPTRKQARYWNQLTNYSGLHLDEYRNSYDRLDNVILKTIYRDQQLQNNFQTALQYNLFNEPIAEGASDGNWSIYWNYDLLGNAWSTNKGGIATIKLTDLNNKISFKAQSATQNLPQITYTENNLSNLISLGPDDLEVLQSQRDNSGRIVNKFLPQFITDDPFSPKNLPLTFIASNQYKQIGNYTLTWVEPSETQVVANQVVLTSIADNKTTFNRPITSSGHMQGIDVSQIPSGVYTYKIKFYAQDDTQQEVFHSKGTVQFNNGVYSNSSSMVVEVQNGNSLLLSGYTRGITGVQLMQNGKQIAQVPVQSVPNNQDNFTADLSSYSSGVYNVVPIIPNVSNLPQSLPFTIYTNIPSATPIAQEIPCQITLYTFYADNGQRAQLAWTLPPQYSQLSVTMNCVYEDMNGSQQAQQATIAPGTNLGVYTDSKGGKLTCNNNFPSQIKGIKSITITVPLSANENVNVVNNFVPSQTQGNNTTVIVTNSFNPSVAQYIKPVTGYSSLPTLQYVDTTKDRSATLQNITAVQMTSAGVVLDTSILLQGYYPLFIPSPTPNVPPTQASFSVTEGAMVFPGNKDIPAPPVLNKPYYQYGLDNWNNITRQIDTLNNPTLYDFTIDNKCSKVTQAPVDVQNLDGTITKNVNPVTVTNYDNLSNRVAVTRPNGNAAQNAIPNTEGFWVDEAGQVCQDILPDGTYAARFTYNALSQVSQRTIRSGGNDYNYVLLYDHRNNMISETYPSGKVWKFTYNEINMRYKQETPPVKNDQGGASEKIYYGYNIQAQISENALPQGQVTKMEYDRNNKPLAILYPDSAAGTNVSQLWQKDYSGFPLAYVNGQNNSWSHSDISGTNYYVQLNNKKEIVAKWSDDAKIATGHGPTAVLWSGPSEGQFKQSANYLAPQKQNLAFVYQRGLLIQANDYTNGRITLNQYDTENRRQSYSLWVSIHSNSTPDYLIREVSTEYDAIGREKKTKETQATISKYYDLNSNIIHQHIHVKLQGGNAAKASGWNQPDSCDRMLIYGGILDNSDKKIKIGPSYQGYSYGYTDGYRVSQSYYPDDTGNLYSQSITYEPDGWLQTVSSTADNVTIVRAYDEANRPLAYNLVQSTSPLRISNYNNYNSNGWITGSQQNQIDISGNVYNVSTLFFGGFCPDGQAAQQRTDYNPNTNDWLLDELNGIYLLFDDFELTTLGGTRTFEKNGTTTYSSCSRYIDCNGIVNAQIGVNCSQYNVFNAQFGVVVLDTTYDGMILTRHELLGIDNLNVPTSIFNSTQFIYDMSGNAVAEYTVNYGTNNQFGLVNGTPSFSESHRINSYGSKPSSYNTQLLNGNIISRLLSSTSNTKNWLSKVAVEMVSSKQSIQQSLANSLFESQQVLVQTSQALDIVRPIDQTYPPLAPPTYVAMPGQDATDISNMQFGDTFSSNNVASANNFFGGPTSGDDAAAAGQNLVLPQQINSKYQAGTALPYQQFMNTVLMTMYPQLKFNPPKEHHVFLSEVVHAIVDTAAEIIGSFIGTLILGPVFGAVAGRIIGATVTTALADAGYQDLAVHENWQPYFNLKASLTAGLEAGAESGIMPPSSMNSLNQVISINPNVINTTLNSLLNISANTAAYVTMTTLEQAGTVAVLDQLIELSLGETDKFDFTAVLTAMVSAVAMEPLGSEMPNKGTLALPDSLIQNMTGNLIQSGLYDTLTGQTLYVSQIAAGALGATLGNALGEEVIAVSLQGASTTNPRNKVSGSAGAVSDGSVDPSTGNNATNANGTVNNGITGASGVASSAQVSSSSASASGSTQGSASTQGGQGSGYTSYSASRNPGRNSNGFFAILSSGNNPNNINSGLSSNNASQGYSSSNSIDGKYGSGNATPTSKYNITITSGSAVSGGLLQAAPSKWQQFIGDAWETLGIINGTGDSAAYIIQHPINAVVGGSTVVLDLFKYGLGIDNPSTSSQLINNFVQGMNSIVNATQSADPYRSGYARGTILGTIGSIPFYEDAVATASNLSVAVTKSFGIFRINDVAPAVTVLDNSSADRPVSLDWSRTNLLGTNAAEHVIENHGNMNLNKPNQGIFYGDPVWVTNEAWNIAQQNGIKPITIAQGNVTRDYYIITRANSGYAGGMGGQLENYNNVTIVTETGTNRVITAFPSGATPPLKGYQFTFGVTNEQNESYIYRSVPSM